MKLFKYVDICLSKQSITNINIVCLLVNFDKIILRLWDSKYKSHISQKNQRIGWIFLASIIFHNLFWLNFCNIQYLFEYFCPSKIMFIYCIYLIRTKKERKVGPTGEGKLDRTGTAYFQTHRLLSFLRH